MSDAIHLPTLNGYERARAISTELKRAARRSRLPVSVVSGGGGFQARRGDRWFIRGIYLSFALVVALPILLTTIYVGLLAADQYSTEARLSLRAGESSMLDSFAGLAGLGTSQSYQDALLIADFARSRGMVEELEKQVSLRDIFSRKEADYLSSFRPDRPIEDLVKYWRSQLDTSIDSASGVITLNLRAFRPDDSLLLMEKIIAISEKLVNELSKRARDDGLRVATEELKRAEDGRRRALTAMQEARNEQGVLDGTIAATALEKTILALNLQLATLQEQAAVQAPTMSANSPSSRVLASRIASLKEQIGRFRDQLATSDGTKSDSLATRLNILDRYRTELEIAEKQYAASVASYEAARIEASTQKSYLVPFITPTLAEKALYPRRWLIWSIITIPALLLWSIGVGLAYLIRDYVAV